MSFAATMMSSRNAFLLAVLVLLPASNAWAQTLARDAFVVAAGDAAQAAPGAWTVALMAASVADDGAADAWLSLWYAPQGPRGLAIVAAGAVIVRSELGLDEVNLLLGLTARGLPVAEVPETINETGLFPPRLPERWLNSNRALEAGARLGGADFLEAHPDAVVSALLLGVPKEGPLAIPGPIGAVWLLAYLDPLSGDYLLMMLEAQTGLGLALQPADALDVLPRAEAAAQAWQPGAALVSVRSVLPDLSLQGRAPLWAYTYVAPGGTDARTFFVDASGLIAFDAEPIAALPSLEPLPDSWLSSTQAAAQASLAPSPSDAAFGTFAQAHLSRGLSAARPGEVLWQFDTLSPLQGEMQTALVNATATSTASRGDGVPSVTALLPSAPNPFTTSARLAFTVADASPVMLEVIDLLGRRVATLAEGPHATGHHEVVFDGQNLPSGVYLVRFQAGERVSTQRLVRTR